MTDLSLPGPSDHDRQNGSPSNASASTAMPDSIPTANQESTVSGFVSTMMDNNPYFSAGAGLMGIGVALTVLRRTVTLSTTLAQRRLLVTLEIPSKDRSYPWFLEWMASQTPSSQASSSTSSTSSLLSMLRGQTPLSLKSHQLAVETSYKQHENGSSEALFSLVPGPGTHWFRYKGAWMQVKRERDSKLMDLHSGSPFETVTLTTLSRDRHLFPLLLSEARALADKGTEGKTVVYTAWGAEWRVFGKPRRKREVGSVVLEKGMAERVEGDLKEFLGRGKWYAERGIPYRRGYLLHGPPGSGKTSFIQALAGSLSYNICLLNLSERGLTDDKLNHLLGLVPERSVVLLEDVDAAFNRRVQTSEDGYKSSVTFSGLLNALDGVASAEERIIFMTTNHFSHLDPALVRPGRVDLIELLDDARAEQAERLFLRFYGRGKGVVSEVGGRAGAEVTGEDQSQVGRTGKEEKTGLVGMDVGLDEAEIKSLAEELSRVVEEEMNRGRRVSMASLQGHFIRNDPRESIEKIRDLFASRESGGS